MVLLAAAALLLPDRWIPGANKASTTTSNLPASAESVMLDVPNAFLEVDSTAKSTSSVTLVTPAAPLGEQAPELDVTTAGKEVRIGVVSVGSTPSADLDLTVQLHLTKALAKKASLDLTAASGTIRLAGTYGTVAIRQGIGDVSVSGSLDDLTVASRVGSITSADKLSVAGKLRARTEVGGIGLALSGGAPQGPVKLSTGAGAISLSIPSSGVYETVLASKSGKTTSSLEKARPNIPGATKISLTSTSGSIALSETPK